jgi:hypothetical protein
MLLGWMQNEKGAREAAAAILSLPPRTIHIL